MRGTSTIAAQACIVAVAVIVTGSLFGRVSCFVPSVRCRSRSEAVMRQRNNYGRSIVSVSMHMGHSHTHQHSHDGTIGIRPTSPPATISSSQKQQQQQQQLPVWAKRRRISALLLFCAITFLGPPLARHRQLANSDVAAFLVTATSLFLLEPIRDQVKHVLWRIRQLSDGISRHSSPISAKYIFKNENAADRITLVG